ncbi:MAG: TolC family protein, partial [Candidatus Omnitrophica bacterium]|nr:TolC family protein [Candidatus Omnitrophota bacterium]
MRSRTLSLAQAMGRCHFLTLVGIVTAIFIVPGGYLWAMARRPPVEIAVTEDAEPVSLTLADSFYAALRRSETVAIAREEIEKTEGQFLKATAEALGDFDFYIHQTYQEHQRGDAGSSSIASTYIADLRRERKFTYSQPIFQGFKSLGAIVGAGSLRNQRKQEWVRSEDLLFLEVVSAFYRLLSQNEDVRIIREIHRLLSERIRDLEAREKIGRSRLSEVSTAKAKLKSLEADLAASRGLLAVSDDILEYLTGLPTDAHYLKDDPWSEKTTAKLSEYLKTLSSRPDVEAAREAVRTAKQAVVVAQSSLWPQMTLDLNQYEKREGFQSGIDWDLLLKIDVPLFRGGENLGNLKEAISDWKKSQYMYSLAKRRAILDIKESYRTWKSSAQRWKALEEAVKASEENYRIQKSEYLRNLVNNLDVLEALESLLRTRREANWVFYQMKENHWRLQVATGKYRELIG